MGEVVWCATTQHNWEGFVVWLGSGRVVIVWENNKGFVGVDVLG